MPEEIEELMDDEEREPCTARYIADRIINYLAAQSAKIYDTSATVYHCNVNTIAILFFTPDAKINVRHLDISPTIITENEWNCYMAEQIKKELQINNINYLYDTSIKNIDNKDTVIKITGKYFKPGGIKCPQKLKN